MQAIPSIQTEDMRDLARRLPKTFNVEHLGSSNMLKTMAHSQNALDGYLSFVSELERSSLDPVLAEQIALTLAQLDQSDYALAEHTARARQLGLNETQILASREGRVANPKTSVVLRFARSLSQRSGECAVSDLRKAGYHDREIVDIIAAVGVNVFANLFNWAAKTDVHFESAGAVTQTA